MARRVNSKFLVFLMSLTGIVLVIAVLALYIHKGVRSVDSKQLIDLVDAEIAKGDLEKAASLLKDGRDQAPDNTEILVKLGDVLNRLTGKDPNYLGQARIQWNKAVSIDPHCVPALRSLLKSYGDELDISPRPFVFIELKRVCDRLLNLDPSDLAAQEKKQIAVILEWYANQTASNEEVQASIEKYLPALIKKDPDNAELPRILALARIQQAGTMLEANNDKLNARRILDDAMTMLEAARSGRDQNADMQYRVFQSYLRIRDIYPDVKTDKEKTKFFDGRINDCIALALKAASTLDPSKDPLCVSIYQSASEWASQQGKSDEAESIIRDFYDKHPNEQRARLTLARVLELKSEAKQDPKWRAEAVSILKKDVQASPDLEGLKALEQRELAAQTVEELIRIHLGDFASAPSTDKSRRDQIAAMVDEELEKLRHLYQPESIPVLNLEGRFQLLKGENVEAVKTLEQAVLQMSPTNLDSDILYQLAKAYMLTDQFGRAKQRLEQVILKLDAAVPPRVLLARVLLKLGDVPGLAVQLKRLHELAPESPEVKQLETSRALVESPTNPGLANVAYRQLPETTREQRLYKAQLANALTRNDEAVRILEAFLKDAPENSRQLAQLPSTASTDEKKDAAQKVSQDIQASLKLAQIYANNLDQKQTAKRVIADALAIHADDPALVESDARLHDLLPDDIYERVLKAIEKAPDPFNRTMLKYDIDSRLGVHPERVIGDLLVANSLKPHDIQVLSLMFAYYATARNFDKATPLVEELAQLNADQCGGLMFKFRLMVAKGELAAAEDLGRQLTQTYSEFAAGWLVTAELLQQRGKFDEAVRFYLEVMNRQPDQIDAYRGLIECYVRLNQPDNAETKMAEARKRYPDDPIFRDQMLVFLVNSGKAAQALPEREKLLADDKQKQRDVADDYLQLAKAYFHAAQDEATAKPPEAADHMNKAFQTLVQGAEKFPAEPLFPSQLAEMYLYNRQQGEGEKVLKAFRDRPELKDDPQPSLLFADFYLRAGDLANCEVYLNEAMVRAEKKQGSPDLQIRLRLASLQAQQGKYDAAFSTLNGVGSKYESDPLVTRQKFEIKVAQGQRDEARKGIEAELAKHDSPELRLLLATLMIDNHEIDPALKELDRVLSQDPRNDAAIFLQCLAIANTGKVDQAISQLIGLRNRDPRNPQFRLLLSELYLKSGKTILAINELSGALPKMPINRQVRLSLIQLYGSLQPLTNDALISIVTLCQDAQADPVLRLDPTWARQAALAYANMMPPNVPLTVHFWQQAISLAPDKPEYRRDFIETLIKFRDWGSVINETDKLIKDGHNEWWLHYQRGIAMGRMGQKDKSLAEFDEALKLTDVKASPAQSQIIVRGIGMDCGHQLAVDRLTPLLGNDGDGSWHVLLAHELRADGQFQRAEGIIDQLLADPLNRPAERRVPLLQTKGEICMAYADSETKDPAKALAQYITARDAYLEMSNLAQDNIVALNNLAYLLSERIPPPEGGPLKAKVYSTRAYDQVRFGSAPNITVVDTQGWVLTLCGGDDAVEGMAILHKMIVERDDTKTFVEGRYHLGEAYLRAAKPNLAEGQKWLKEAMALIADSEKTGRPVDAALKDKIQTSLAKVAGPVTSGQ